MNDNHEKKQKKISHIMHKKISITTKEGTFSPEKQREPRTSSHAHRTLLLRKKNKTHDRVCFCRYRDDRVFSFRRRSVLSSSSWPKPEDEECEWIVVIIFFFFFSTTGSR
jgi:hypothetical protein